MRNLTTGSISKNIKFISQDKEAVLPQFAYTDQEGHKLLNYIGIIPVLTKSIQELSKQVDSLTAEANELREKVKR